MKEEKQLQMPVNLFLGKSIELISKKLEGTTPSSITLFLFQSLNDIKTAQNPEDFKKIYQKLVGKMIDFYNESQQPDHLLPIFGYLLGNADLRHTCENIASEKDLLPSEIKSINLSNINIKTLEFPKEIESNLIKKNQISKGSFASIHKGQYGEKKVVFKIFEMDEKVQLYQTLSKIEEEIKIHSMLNHKNIAELIGVIRIPSFLIPMMVIEYVGSDLLDVMNFLRANNKKFSDEQLFQIMFDVVSAIAYLHQNNIIHRDIKPDNILIQIKGQEGQKFDTKHGAKLSAKLADFGLASILEKDSTQKRGSPAYVAPEILMETPHNLSADIYSLGITLWELFHLDLFENEVIKTTNIDKNQKMKLLKEKILAGERAKIKTSASPKVSELITKCWLGNPKQRPEAGMIQKDLEKNKTGYFPSLK